MALVAVCSVKASPGVTTTALALASAATLTTPTVLLECDLAGGDLRRRHRLAAKPDLVDLTATARTVTSGVGVFDALTQPVRVGERVVPVVLAPAGEAPVRAALPELCGPGQAVLVASGSLVIADCGRVDLTSPARAVLALADVVLVMVRALPEELAHVRERLDDLLTLAPHRVVVLLAAGGIYPAVEVLDVFGRHLVDHLARQGDEIGVRGPLPHDRRGADVVNGRLLPGRRWSQLPLIRAVDALATDLGPRLAIRMAGRMSGRGQRRREAPE
jgi:hypothetical protein